jgi:hypothetical protein
MRRRAAVKPVIGHLKDDHRMGRNYLKGRDGDRINAILAAAGYNFSLLRRWFERLLRALLLLLSRAILTPSLAEIRVRKYSSRTTRQSPSTAADRSGRRPSCRPRGSRHPSFRCGRILKLP